MEEETADGIGDAPMSIINREEMERHVADSYMYIPDLGDVPEINVPMDLPDLPGELILYCSFTFLALTTIGEKARCKVW